MWWIIVYFVVAVVLYVLLRRVINDDGYVAEGVAALWPLAMVLAVAFIVRDVINRNFAEVEDA